MRKETGHSESHRDQNSIAPKVNGAGLISHREVLEQLATMDYRAGRLNRRGYARMIQLAMEYRFTKAEAKGILQTSRDRLAESGLRLPEIKDLERQPARTGGRLMALAVLVLTIQLLWWMAF